MLLIKTHVVRPQSLLCKPGLNKADRALLVQTKYFFGQWIGRLEEPSCLRKVLLLFNRGKVRLQPLHHRVDARAGNIEELQEGRKPSSAATCKAVPHSCGCIEAEGGLALSGLLAVNRAESDPVVSCAFL